MSDSSSTAASSSETPIDPTPAYLETLKVAQAEIERSSTAIQASLGVALRTSGLAITAITIVGAFFFWKTVGDFKDDLRLQFDHELESATSSIQAMKSESELKLDEAQSLMWQATNRLAEEAETFRQTLSVKVSAIEESGRNDLDARLDGILVEDEIETRVIEAVAGSELIGEDLRTLVEAVVRQNLEALMVQSGPAEELNFSWTSAGGSSYYQSSRASSAGLAVLRLSIAARSASSSHVYRVGANGIQELVAAIDLNEDRSDRVESVSLFLREGDLVRCTVDDRDPNPQSRFTIHASLLPVTLGLAR